MIVTLRRGRRGLREYQAGDYPVPAWSYGAPPAAPCAPCAGGPMSKRRANRIVAQRMAALGYTGPYDSSLPENYVPPPPAPASTFNPVGTYDPSIPWIGSGAPPVAPSGVYSVAPGGGSLTSIQLANIAGVGQPTIAPAVSPATLLAAAALPGAPAVVRQAAASYSAADPFSSLLSGTIFGLPSYIVLGGGLLLVAALASRGRR
jgi:hypothetical protein